MPKLNVTVSPIDIGRVVTTLNGIQNITTIDQLNAQKANLMQAVTDLKTHVTDQDAQISDLSQQVSASQAILVDLQTRNSSLTQQVTAQQAIIDGLNRKLAAVAAAPTGANSIALADSFRKVVDSIQTKARLQSASGPATTIKSMDIEVKGLVSLQDDGSTVMVLPTLAAQIDASQLSTLRVSYAAVPGTGSAPPPAVSSLTPNRGPSAGGTSVVIAGSGFTGTGAVLFGGSPAASFTAVSDTQVTAVSPGGAGAVDVVVVTAAGGASTTSAADQFTYIPAPVVTSVNPLGGPAAGGTQVTISGTGFTGATKVMFGSVAAPAPKVVSDTQITVVSPVGSAGTVDIVVTAPSGTSNTSPADQFVYNPSAPTVTAINPRVGPVAGGTQVTVTGTSFIGVTAVTFGRVASKFDVSSDTQIVAVSPKAAAVGAVDVVVTTPSGNSASTQADQFAYQAPPGQPEEVKAPRRGKLRKQS